MPLSEGTTKKARQKNIETEIAHGKDPKQAVAIGYSKQRENVAKKAASHRKDSVRDDAVVKRLIADLHDKLSRIANLGSHAQDQEKAKKKPEHPPTADPNQPHDPKSGKFM